MFIIKNFLPIALCWISFELGLITKQDNTIQIIGIIFLGIFTFFIFGGELIIYCIYIFRQNYKNSLKILAYTLVADAISLLSFGSGSYRLTFDLILSQIIGFIMGIVIKLFIKFIYKYKSQKI